MVRKFEDVMASLPKERQEVINHGIEQLIAEEMTLQEIRKAHDYSQKVLANALNVNQGTVSKMERQADMLVSTLRSFIEAMGGTLEITASFPGHTPVKISQFDDLQENTEEREAESSEEAVLVLTHEDRADLEATTFCKNVRSHRFESIGVQIYNPVAENQHVDWEVFHSKEGQNYVVRDNITGRLGAVRIMNKTPFAGAHGIWSHGHRFKP